MKREKATTPRDRTVCDTCQRPGMVVGISQGDRLVYQCLPCARNAVGVTRW